ncbi:MAG: type I DNA topoisomerase [Acidimicrobiia bacterium]
MAKPLVIVESPAKARTIAGFLGKDFVVESSVGHIRDLPRGADDVPDEFRTKELREIGRLGVNVNEHFKPIYIVPAEKKKVVTELKRKLKEASEVYLATDEDREGEAIAWHVLEVLKPKVPVKRMVFHEITRQAIEEAVANSRELDMKLVEAQEARRVLDRLYGYEVSPVGWKKIRPGLSAGRVQSVATRLIVERERARMAFRSADYWDVEAALSARNVAFTGKLAKVDGKRVAEGRDFDANTGALRDPDAVIRLGEVAARSVAEGLDRASLAVRSVETTDWRDSPRPPFITSTLQVEASNKLGFGSAKTMAIAQRLYERGYITYMRTDSTNLSEQAVAAARNRVRELYGNDFLPDQPRSYRGKVKNAQEAHEAIRPAGEQMRTLDEVSRELDADERRLYELVWKRTIACQMADARGQRVAMRISARTSGGQAVEFASNGRTIEFAGFMRAYVEGSDNPDAELEDRESPIPQLNEGESVACTDVTANQHITQPPRRFSEAGLVKELEQRGIGRPSTYASIISTIQDRGYAFKKGNSLVPTWTAFAKVQLLERYFGHLIDYGFTAQMEEELDSIARGEGEGEKYLHQFYWGDGSPGLKELVGDDNIAQIDPREVCTVHIGADGEGREVVVRVGRYGPYLQRGEEERASIPDDIPPDELTTEVATQFIEQKGEGDRIIGNDPASGLPVIAKAGRFGPYVQLGELNTEDKKAPKPKTASLFKTMALDTVSLHEALQLLSLPRVVGNDPDGNEIVAANGRYGPYIQREFEGKKDSRSLDSEEQLFTVTVDDAMKKFAEPKRRGRGAAKPPLAELGEHPDNGAQIRLLDGRFGPYVTDGTTNASLPRGKDPDHVTLDEAVALLRERAAKGPVKKRTKKAAAKKSATKKSAAKKASAKKAAAKKAATKRAAPKKAAGE